MASRKLGSLIIDFVGKTAEIDKSIKDVKKDVNILARDIDVAFKAVSAKYLIQETYALGKAIVDVIAQTEKLIDETGKFAVKYGVTVEKAASFRYEMEVSRITLDQFAFGMRTFARNLFMASGNAGRAAKILKAWKMEIVDSSGKFRDINELLVEVAENIKNLGDKTEQTAIAQYLFERYGERLLPYLKLGKEGIQELEREFDVFGIKVTKDMAIYAAELHRNMVAISSSFKNVRFSLAETLNPALVLTTNLIKDYIYWLKESWEAAKRLGGSIVSLFAPILNMAREWDAVMMPRPTELLETLFPFTEASLRRIKAAQEELNATTDDYAALWKEVFGADQYSKTQDLLINKLSSLRAQIVSLYDPIAAARMQLKDFIDKTTQGMPAAFAEEIKELTEAFEEYYTLSTTQARVQTEVSNAIKLSSTQTNNAIRLLKDSYEQGEGSLTQYFDKERELITKGYNEEVTQLKILQATRLNKDEQDKISQDLILKEIEYRQKLHSVLMEEKTERGKLANIIEELNLGGADRTRIFGIPSDVEISDRYNSMLEQVKLFSDEYLEIKQQTVNKELLLYEIIAAKEIELEQNKLNRERAIQAARLGLASDVFGQLGSLFSQAYNLAEEDGEAYFYFQKAMAIGQAIMNTAVAVTKAMGMGSFLSPGEIAAYVNIIKAIGAAQVGIISAQALKGPPKYHEGGQITGENGKEVGINAEIGEYMLKKRAVDYYGLAGISALNNMMLPKERLYSRSLDVTGGAAYTLNIPIHVDNDNLAKRLRGEIESTTIRVMREYAR